MKLNNQINIQYQYGRLTDAKFEDVFSRHHRYYANNQQTQTLLTEYKLQCLNVSWKKIIGRYLIRK